MYGKISLLPWAKERFRTALTPFNDGFPDWEGHSNTFSFEYPGALPKVNLKKVTLGIVQVPLRKLEIQANKYNDSWYPLYRDGKRTGGQVRVSFMLCPMETIKDSSSMILPRV